MGLLFFFLPVVCFNLFLYFFFLNTFSECLLVVKNYDKPGTNADHDDNEEVAADSDYDDDVADDDNDDDNDVGDRLTIKAGNCRQSHHDHDEDDDNNNNGGGPCGVQNFALLLLSCYRSVPNLPRSVLTKG